MSIDIYKRLDYLNEFTERLVELDESEDALRLTSFYGLTSKEICFKNQIKSFRWDKIKLKRCPKCYAHISFNLNKLIELKSDQQNLERTELNRRINFKVKHKHLIIQCKQCEHRKPFIITSKHKTVYEKLLFGSK